MTTYITTVTLRNALQADFDNLDQEMVAARFVPVRQKNAGQTDAAAEYSLKTALSLPDVITAAYQAAKRTGKDYSLTVMKSKKLIAA